MSCVFFCTYMTTFAAEITQVSVRKLVSGDREYKVVMITNEPQAIQLDEYVGADRLVRITVAEEE